MNKYPIVYYLRKMLSAEQNSETYDVKLMAVVKDSKTWHHYFERAAYTIIVFTYLNNLKKFIEQHI